jgi:pentatricopeptide repeat protein
MKEDLGIELETGDYNVLLAAYARIGDGRRAQGLLKDMIDNGVDADVISYNCVLDSWAKCTEEGAAERAEMILTTLQRNYDNGYSYICPNPRSYATVVKAWQNSNSPYGAQRAEAILERMEQLDACSGRKLNVCPDAFTYTGVVSCFVWRLY